MSSAMAGSPKVHGPHCRELSLAKKRAMRADSTRPHAAGPSTTITPTPTGIPTAARSVCE